MARTTQSRLIRVCIGGGVHRIRSGRQRTIEPTATVTPLSTEASLPAKMNAVNWGAYPRNCVTKTLAEDHGTPSMSALIDDPTEGVAVAVSPLVAVAVSIARAFLEATDQAAPGSDGHCESRNEQH